MNEQEIELFRSMLEMLGQAGEASVWILVAWWGISLLKMIILVGCGLWGVVFVVKTLVMADRECSQISSWCHSLGQCPTPFGRASAMEEITRLIHESKGGR